MEEQSPFRLLSSGIEKLDLALGGGLPEFSFNVLTGEPGSGKTILAHQIAFANGTPDRPALYFTMLGESSLKRLRYQQKFSYFDVARVGESILFEDLSSEALKGDLYRLLDLVMERVEKVRAGVVIIDSFRTVLGSRSKPGDEDFLHQLALRLTNAEATTILVGEYVGDELQHNPVFAIADGVIGLRQSVIRNSMVRKLRIHKLRGMDLQPGLHTFRITSDGIAFFPRMISPVDKTIDSQASSELISIGNPELDEMLGGGILEGSSILVAGPSGSGKTTVGLQFIAEGVKKGVPGVLALFEETVPTYRQQAMGFGIDLQKMIDAGLLELVYIRPLDLSVDETLYAIQSGIERVGARRVVIDSITALENALAPTFREEYRESLYRLIGAMTAARITILMTVEITTSYQQLEFTPHAISFLTHDLILQRYFEVEGQLRTFLSIIKTRGRKHSRELREYQITSNGIEIGDALREFQGVITAVPQRVAPKRRRGPRDRK
ncbi:MAG: ATPase domain-containing protein [Pseudomonadota bacterium]|nr:ATPase domain-containing protein [Pseudomonadota bacterium]